MCEQGKFSLKTSLGQMGKQFYTTQLDWNQDFVVLVVDSSRVSIAPSAGQK